MARTPNPAAKPAHDPTATDVVAQDHAAANQLATLSAQVAEQFDEGRTYDRERLIAEARFFMAQTGEAFCNAGKRLIVIKENEPHGEFLTILERLDVAPRLAQRAMQSALKFLAPAVVSKASAPTLLGLSQTKLVELLAEPDEAIEALADGGTVAGKTLDEIQAMTTRELRAALLEARKQLGAKDTLIAKKDQKINDLVTADEMRRAATGDELEAQQLQDLRDATLAADAALAQLLAAVDEVTSNAATPSAELAARQTLDYVTRRLADAAASRGLALNLDGDVVVPAHMQPVHETAAKGRRTRN